MKTTARLPIPAEVLGLMWISLCAFAAYHAPQPLFPSIQEEFGISQSTVTLITACVLFPLGLAPMFYGILLGRLSMRRTLPEQCSLCQQHRHGGNADSGSGTGRSGLAHDRQSRQQPAYRLTNRRKTAMIIRPR